MQLNGKDGARRALGAACIVAITLWVLVRGASIGGSSAQRTSTVVKHTDGFKYRKVAQPKYTGPKEKATFVTLARNQDLYSLLGSIASIEDRFNSKFQYDWIFLNDEEFSEEFKRVTTAMVSGQTKYGLVPEEHWSYPSWIDKGKAAAVREEMREKKIIYGDSESYRHMCRYESGFFYRHELLQDYDWYWRVEPDTRIYCDVDYDVFKFMRDNGKKYGFTISLKEYVGTIETLWNTTLEFTEKNPSLVHPNNMMDFISDDGGLSYNLCHFWSNFEVGWLDLWRGPAYSAYFDHLDHAGGFFYERWGDAPVHSIGAALFLDRSEIHHFGDLGYFHIPFHACPIDLNTRLENRCNCDPNQDFTWKGYSCTSKFYTVSGKDRPAGWQKYAD
ncbi:alpha-1,2-mannosyltransferase KTR1 [Lachancea thermotolerans CBS 6340]|uniref:KLTH0G07942p n=1 Tax=Lachancea thermotolerans (strain ATCC 56472 / CBS 6340 / NRRL Y-8284) TaxID=559295 RepID=C5DMD4_LACTC|nr:KLTH0G07942p [Lachancea thermotolerans CBS 6340]CAR24945.1 KLTH0G07942p [Lachancea thermotolerans CBS 6340]